MGIVQILGIEGASITWSCKQICTMIEGEKFSFDNIVQRSYVWEVSRRSELIWSLIMGYPVPPIYAKRGEGNNPKFKIYDVLDGQQRELSIFKYRKDEYALSNLQPIPFLDEDGEEQTVDISGMKYSELPEELQSAIDNRTISVSYYDTLSQAQQAEMFRRLNNGKQLSTKSRTLASCKDIAGIIDIGSHKLFSTTKEGGMLTAKAIESKNQVTIIMKIWCMLNQDVNDISFESKIFNPLLENTVVSETEKLEMIEIFNYICSVHDKLIEKKKKPVAKKLFTETHLVSLIPYIKKSLEDGIDEDMVADWLINFFGNVPDEYDNACNGSAKSTNIKIRDKVFADSYSEFFKTEKDNELHEDNDGNEENSSGNVRELVDNILDDLDKKKQDEE